MKTINVRKLNGLREKTQGLIGRKNVDSIYFETRWGIHTFFLKKPICVLVLDRENVIQSTKVVHPFRIYCWNPRYYRVVELLNYVPEYNVGEEVEIVSM